MFLILSTIVLVAILTYLYIRWCQVRLYWSRRSVPHDSPHPILGSLTFLQKTNASIWMRQLYEKFNKSPVVGIWLFWRPALVINCSDIARRVFVKDADVFRNRLVSSGKTDPIGGLNLFTVNDPIWSNIRKRLTSVFTTARLKVYQTLMITKSKQLCERIRKETKQGNVIDLRNVLTDYTTDLVGSAAFGIECDATSTGDCPLRRVTRDFQTYSVFRGFAHTCIFFFPEMVDLFRLSFFPKETTDYFRRIWSAVLQQRGGYETPIEDNRDLVDTLIKIKQDSIESKEEIPDDVIIAQAAIMVQGGFETSAGTLSFAIYELAHDLVAQEKLYQEVLAIKQKLGDKDFDMEVLANANYLNAVFKETLRKYPPMGWFDRISSQEYKIQEGLTIPAGTTVYVNTVGMQMDPDYFPDPEKFLPERFLPENEKDIKPFTYSPFGEGPRNCIGRRFAHLTMRFALSALILNYEFRPRPDSPKPNDIQLEKYALFLMPGQILNVDFVPRTH